MTCNNKLNDTPSTSITKGARIRYQGGKTSNTATPPPPPNPITK